MKPENKNQQLFREELADSVRQLYSLELILKGKGGTFCEWAQIVYELNEDWEETYFAAVRKICDAFHEVAQNFGEAIAQQLYNAHTIILATEIRNAARYLYIGGQMNHLPELAAVGFFLTGTDDDRLKRAVAFMNAGGCADDIWAI